MTELGRAKIGAWNWDCTVEFGGRNWTVEKRGIFEAGALNAGELKDGALKVGPENDGEEKEGGLKLTWAWAAPVALKSRPIIRNLYIIGVFIMLPFATGSSNLTSV